MVINQAYFTYVNPLHTTEKINSFYASFNLSNSIYTGQETVIQITYNSEENISEDSYIIYLFLFTYTELQKVL